MNKEINNNGKNRVNRCRCRTSRKPYWIQYIASVTISTPEDVVETTAFGPVGARTRTSGLKDHSIALEFHNDFASGAMEDIIDGIGIGQLANIIIKPTSAAVSATNPAYKADDSGSGATKAGQVLISEWTPLNGAVGELSTVSVTWPVSGQIVRATS
jgi:hypothetical protein